MGAILLPWKLPWKYTQKSNNVGDRMRPRPRSLLPVPILYDYLLSPVLKHAQRPYRFAWSNTHVVHRNEHAIA